MFSPLHMEFRDVIELHDKLKKIQAQIEGANDPNQLTHQVVFGLPNDIYIDALFSERKLLMFKLSNLVEEIREKQRILAKSK